MNRFLVPILFSALGTSAFAQQEAPSDKPAPDAKPKAEEKKADKPESKQVPPVESKGSVTIANTEIRYRTVTGKLELKDDAGKPRAAIFHVAYLREGVDSATRPVLFAFNGGPGSSAVWLHLGALGPQRVKMDGDGTSPPVPPAILEANPESILDVADIVFIDPVSTGYSRATEKEKAGDFHGVKGDIESVGDFIRRWTTENKRWGSPKYIIGESYGGVRAAGLADHLQSRYGMSLNGIILLSSLIDFQTLSPSVSNDLPYITHLPTYASVAHFHGKLGGDRDALLKEAREFAFGEYASALLQGSALDPIKRKAVAEKVSQLTGLPVATVEAMDLRIDPSRFRTELLRDQGKIVGRFDARVAWETGDRDSNVPDQDPSFSNVYGAFSTTMLSYLQGPLNWQEDQPYEILTGKISPWKWDVSNGYVSTAQDLSEAMSTNPHLRVLVMCGKTDLATVPDGILYSVRHLGNLPPSRRDAISIAWYDGGHMFYLNPADRKKMRTDLLGFLAPPAH